MKAPVCPDTDRCLAWKCKGSQKAGRKSGLKTAEVLHMQHLCLPRLDTRQVPITFSKSSIGGLVSEEIVQTTWGEFSQPIWSLEVQSGFCTRVLGNPSQEQKNQLSATFPWREAQEALPMFFKLPVSLLLLQPQP